MRLATRLTLVMTALVFFTAVILGLPTYRNVAALALPIGLDRIDTKARLEALRLEGSVRGAREDVMAFRASASIDDIMTAHRKIGTDPAQGAVEAEWRKRLAGRFAADLAANPNYYELRLVGVEDGGREFVRADRAGPGGAIRIVLQAGARPRSPPTR